MTAQCAADESSAKCSKLNWNQLRVFFFIIFLVLARQNAAFAVVQFLKSRWRLITFCDVRIVIKYSMREISLINELCEYIRG